MTDLAALTALVRKYDRPGPRYTSYPTAPQFRSDLDSETILARYREDAAGNDPVSIYVHIPFCDSSCWFCGCHSIITGNKTRADSYLDALERELALRVEIIGEGRSMAQVHWGGGSPSFLTPDRIRRLGNALRKRLRFTDDLDAGVEIDPRDLTPDQVTAFAETGFNRASIGVQDTNEAVQRAVNRIQPHEINLRAAQLLRAAGFRSLNVDLMYGLPRQTFETFERTLDDALELKPDRFAVFSFAHVPWIKPVQKLIRPESLPDSESKIRLLLSAVERLTAAGYVHIGMDHFALPDEELAVAQRHGALRRNFQGYSTKAGLDLHGLGASAISQTQRLYLQNEKEILRYEAGTISGRLLPTRSLELTEEDLIRRNIIMKIMCDLKLDYTALSAELGVDFTGRFRDEIARMAPLEEDGLIARREGGLMVTPAGRLLVRNIAMIFDAYLNSGVGARYSRTV